MPSNREKFLFIFFCFISLLFHFSSDTSKLITNEKWLQAFTYFNIVIHLFFKPIEVFFHEASHGLAAIVTGKYILGLNLSWDGSGYVTYQNTDRLRTAFTAFWGYAGAAIWGYLIYVSSIKSNKVNRFFLSLFCLSFIYYADNLRTLIILASIIIVFLISWCSRRVGGYLLRFIGIFIMVSACFSPSYLIHHRALGDHIIMQSTTGITAIFWIGLWLAISLFCLYEALFFSIRHSR